MDISQEYTLNPTYKSVTTQLCNIHSYCACKHGCAEPSHQRSTTADIHAYCNNCKG